MSETLQWLVCLLIGAAALLYVLRAIGVFGKHAAAGGHCAKCHAANHMAEALRQLDEEPSRRN
jgi:hypothetical protein